MSLNRPLIAIVGDNASICKALSRSIAASGLNVYTFTSGEEFLNSMATRQPDCLLLDLHMPGLSGIDVMRALAGGGWDLPIIIITGRDEPASKAQCLASGAMAYLPKPLDHLKLLRAIGEAVGHPPAVASPR
jgi:FixJ family two-component response regulator